MTVDVFATTPGSSTLEHVKDNSDTTGKFIFNPTDNQVIPLQTEPIWNSKPEEIQVSGGISSRERQHTLSCAMQESIAQKDFFGCTSMHYMAASASDPTAEDESRVSLMSEDDFHNWHLELQDRMSHPIAFYAEMMGDIMYLHQALQQPDAAEFVKAVVKEVNGHIENRNWELVHRSEVPQILRSCHPLGNAPKAKFDYKCDHEI
jgi:hypothetical protein